MGRRYVWVIRRVYLCWHINGYHKKIEVEYGIPVHRTKMGAKKYIKENLNHDKYEIKKYEEA